MDSIKFNRRINIQLEKDVDESISIAQSSGVLTAFLFMVKRKVPEEIIHRLIAGKQLRHNSTRVHH